MATTLKLFFSATLTSTLSTVLATVPTGQTWRVYNLRVASDLATVFTLSILDASSGLEKKIADAMSLNANSAYEISDFVLEAGDVLKGGATNAADIFVFGASST